MGAYILDVNRVIYLSGINLGGLLSGGHINDIFWYLFLFPIFKNVL